MQVHSKSMHGWVKARGVRWKSQPVQTFFQGSNIKYFAVSVPENHLFSFTNLESLIEKVIDKASNHDESYEQTLNCVSDMQFLVTKGPWLRRTGWDRMFIGREMDVLVPLAYKATKAESGLNLVCESVERVIKSCRNGVQDCVDRNWGLIPFWLASVEKHKEETKPFRTHFTDKSISVYTGYWQQLICFCLRVLGNEGVYGVEFTPQQSQCLWKLHMAGEMGSVTSKILDRKVFDFSVSLIMHSDYVEQRSVLIDLCGILGYDLKNKQWRRPANFTPILAGIQYCIRVIMLEYALPSEHRLMFSSLQAIDPMVTFRHVRDRWLVDGEPTPFNYIHKLLNYGMGAAKDSRSRDRVRWSIDGRIMYFDGLALDLNAWRKFIHELFEATEGFMSEHLLFRQDTCVPDVDFYSITDNPNRSDAGYYFALNEPDARKEARRRMLRNLKRSSHWNTLVDMDGNEIEFNQVGVDEYESWVDKFLESVLVLMTLTCGQGGRGTEITSVLYMNTMDTNRNILIEDGQVMFVTEYHKSLAIMDEVKVIPRFLPYRLSRLLVLYLTDVLPFRFLINPDTPRHGFLFANTSGPWSTERQTRALIRETTSQLGSRMTTAEYRHISIAIDRKFMRGYDANVDNNDEDNDNIHDLMSGHSTRAANNHYGRDRGLLHSLTAESIDLCRVISDRWQQWLKFVSRLPRKEDASLSRGLGLVLTPSQRMIQAALRKMFGPAAIFDSKEQEDAIVAIVERVSRLVLILPTGKGKRLIFMLPSLFNTAKTTVIITPTVTSAEDMLKRCGEVGIDCTVYDHSQPRMATIVIIVTETATSSDLAQFLLTVHLANSLDYIIFDEAQKIIIDQKYRQRLEGFKRLGLRVPLIFIAATFPPSFQPSLEKEMCLQTPTYLRSIINRSNVSYRVSRYDGADQSDHVLHMVTMVDELLDGGGKILIYCSNRLLCDRLSGRLSCQKHYSDDKQTMDVLTGWKSGALVASGVLSASIEIAEIRVVIHVGKPYDLINLDQLSSQGGRAGEVVQSTILLSEAEYQDMRLSDPKYLSTNEAALYEFIVTDDCRRKSLSRYINGYDNETDCERLNGERCDNCQVRYSAKEGKRRWDQEEDSAIQTKKVRSYCQHKHEMLGLIYVEDLLRTLQHNCVMCKLQRTVSLQNTGILQTGERSKEDTVENRANCNSFSDMSTRCQHSALCN